MKKEKKLFSVDETTLLQARRMLIAVTGMVVLVAAGFAVKPMLTDMAQREAEATAVQADVPDYQPAEESIATFRDERTRSRSVTVSQLNAIIDDAATDSETRRQAQNALMQTVSRAEQETAIEGLAVAMGFESCVASVGSDTCTVIVRTPSLTRQQAAQILDIASRETGMLSGSIKVIPVE